MNHFVHIDRIDHGRALPSYKTLGPYRYRWMASAVAFWETYITKFVWQEARVSQNENADADLDSQFSDPTTT